MKRINVNILINIPGYLKGQTVIVDVDEKGTPTDRFWRRRFHDAITDHCIEIAVEPKKSKTI